ncbi:phosphoribosylformylglycinamidine cyclo-ligase [Anaplasma bovis]|uniref:phosphoribosylformylglycinamidine cyclo-ligase n=1 Tax=Anaplasma bovis TaxID=186733 RepID=UPI002FF1C583
MGKYLDSGVDIAAADQLVGNIKELSSKTRVPGVVSDLGGFGALFELFKAEKYENPVLVSSTDGVGTKLLVAQSTNNHKSIGIDMVAMCVNDILVQGAKPLFLLDYFATGVLEQHVALEVITGIAEGCRQANISLAGGETAEMPGMYPKGHYDIAGFVVGVAEKDELLPRTEEIYAGDVIVGISSSGLHSNGFSLVRKILKDFDISYTDKCPFYEGAWSDVLLEPTRIYVEPLMQVRKTVKAAAHITGGGFIGNIPRILPNHLAAKLRLNSWKMHDIFVWLKDEAQIPLEEMVQVFNCGIGMVLIVDKEKAAAVMDTLSNYKEQSHVIGEIVQRTGDAVVLS